MNDWKPSPPPRPAALPQGRPIHHHRTLATLLIATVAFLAARAQVITEFQPRIRWGGRCVAADVCPTNDAISIVASESGGLWRTFDTGAHWSHVAGLPMFRMIDVKYLPDGHTIIATGWADSRVTNGGGIWRSGDGGNTWTQPPSANPGCGNRWHAHGIAFEPGTANVYVGTSCGVAISTNAGVDWNHTILPGDDSRIFSVAAHGNGIVDIAGPDGFRRSTNSAASFGPISTTVPPVQWVHGLAASPLEPGVVFLAGPVVPTCTNSTGAALFAGTPDNAGGVNWTPVTTNYCNNGGRWPWVAAEPLPQTTGTNVQVFFGTGIWTYRQNYVPGGPVPRLNTNNWMSLSIDHSDQNGMAFSHTGHLPMWLVSDGGLHRPADFGALVAILFGVSPDRIVSLLGTTWQMAGNASNGFHALQLYEVKGQIGSFGSTTLYAGTQDNGLPASADAGTTWPFDAGAEGYHIQVNRYRTRLTNEPVTFVYPLTPNLVSDLNFQNVRGWMNPTNEGAGIFGNPTLIANATFVQFTKPNTNQTLFALNLTTNQGQTWVTNLATIDKGLIGRPRISISGSEVVIYQAINRGGNSNYGLNVGLVKITGIRSDGTFGTIRVERADNGLGRIGLFSNGEGTFVFPDVYAVDPHDPSHLIAADIFRFQMMASTNGGANWFPDLALTDLVVNRDTNASTQEFAFGFTRIQDPLTTPGISVQAHAIAFDPVRRNHILVGTEASGILRSIDGGRSWERLPGSRNVTGITSFFFRENSYDDPLDTVYVSTYGRGLWKVRLPVGPRCPFQICQRFDPWTRDWIRDPITGDLVDFDIWVNPDFCPICQWLAVAGGQLRGFRLDQEKRLESLAIDGGRVVASSNDGAPIALDNIAVEFAKQDGTFPGCPGCELIVKKGGTIKGLILEDRTVKGIIAGFGQLPLEDTLEKFDPLPPTPEPLEEEQPSFEPSIHVAGTLPGGHIASAAAGTVVTVSGQNFCGSPKCPPVVLEMDGVVVAKGIQVDAKGGFQFTLPLGYHLGSRTITATQELDPKTVLSDSALIVVPVVDQEETGLEVELIRPTCVNTPDVLIAGQALGEHETSTKIALISFKVNDGPETIVCKGCGENPVFAFSAPLPIDCGENVVFVTVVEEGTGKVATRRRVVRRDSKPPEIACPKPIVTQATDKSGAVVKFEVTATDGCTSQPAILCTPPSGSVFPPGTTIVKCVAVDDCGNEAHCEFPVTVSVDGGSDRVTIDSKFVLRWGSGVLESAPTVSGPWETVKDAVNGVYQAKPGDQQRFFRSRR